MTNLFEKPIPVNKNFKEVKVADMSREKVEFLLGVWDEITSTKEAKEELENRLRELNEKEGAK